MSDVFPDFCFQQVRRTTETTEMEASKPIEASNVGTKQIHLPISLGQNIDSEYMTVATPRTPLDYKLKWFCWFGSCHMHPLPARSATGM
ncbi:MAG: hypothetical protein MUP21_08160 [Dehalococcoidia bacterium]|nr:hypothetical protein [Dehalococcoidia bacterium]